MNFAEQFNAVTSEEINVKDLDNLVELYKLARDDYDDKKRIASEANRIVEDYEKKLLEYLMISGKQKYYVDGIGTISTVEKVYVTTPKEPEEKQAFTAFIFEKYGQDGLDKYLGVNSQSLNSLFKILREEDSSLTKLPGTGEMSIGTELRFLKKK